MTNQELIDRYVYAVTKELPLSMREDVDKELRALICDMLEERCGELTPEEKDVRVVLSELGTPSELAGKYDPEGERSLIGPKYFRAYKRILPIVLIAVCSAVTLGVILSILTGEEQLTILSFAEWLGSIWNSLLSVFAVVTIVFAVLELKKVDISGDDISKLPAVPKKSELIPKSDCIIGIVINVVFMGVFLFAPQLICSYYSISDSGVTASAPLFNVDVMKSLWFAWGALFAVGIFEECFRLYKGRHDYSTAIVRIITGIIEIAMTVLIFARRDIINKDGLIILAIIAVCITADIIVSAVKGFKYGSSNK